MEIAQPVVATRPADIVFVIDDSNSMQEEQENLARNIRSFIEALVESEFGVDFRIAVVTTDMNSQVLAPDGVSLLPAISEGQRSSQVSTHPTYPILRLGPRSDEGGCSLSPVERRACFRPMGTGRWIDSNQEPSEIVEQLRQAASVGTCGFGRERGLDAVIAALQATSTETSSTACNQGFLRDEANLVVLFLTDEDDESLLSAQEALTEMSRLKPIEKTRVAVIGAFVDGAPSACRIEGGSPTATCGSLCDSAPPPPSLSNTACDSSSFDENQCPNEDEVCEADQCVFVAARFWPRELGGAGCDSCTSFASADCCTADAPQSKFSSFLEAFETAAVAADDGLSDTDCQGGSVNQRPACLVDSICQDEYDETLRRIAEDLVAPLEIRLEPPASYPPGVVVRIVSSSGVRELVQGEDYEVSPDGRILDLDDARLPSGEESLQVFFTSEESGTIAPRGACPGN